MNTKFVTVAEPTLTCKTCKVDLMQEGCKGDKFTCSVWKEALAATPLPQGEKK